MPPACAPVRELGADSLNFNTPIIALTADIQPQISKKFRHAGANDILLKPFSQDELNTCLNLWLHKGVDKKAVTPTTVGNDGPILVSDPLTEIHELSTDSGTTIVKNIIDLYLQHTPELINEIRQAVNEENNELLFQAAHSLKSSSGNLGAQRLQNTAKLLEQFGRDKRIEDAKGLTATLDATFTSTKLALEEQLAAFQ